MSRTILVTGASGFVGHHLAGAIHDNGDKVIGIGLPLPEGVSAPTDEYITADLTDSTQMKQLKLPKIDAVIHLAGLASQKDSFDEPQKFITLNSVMFINLCENVRAAGQSPRIVTISTGAVYDSNQTMPLTEDSRVNPTSPYVVSKLTVENLAQYYKNSGLDCVIARPFNHTGPGQALGYILPDLVAQSREAIAKNQAIVVGNLKTRRDYTDVRDVCAAYVALASAPQLNHTLYNICSGRSVAGEELLELVLAQLAPGQKPEIQVDQSKFRPQDQPEIFGSPERLQAETGWKPIVRLEQTIADFISTSK